MSGRPNGRPEERTPVEDSVLGEVILRRLWFEQVIPELNRRGVATPPEEFVEKVQILHRIGAPRLIVRLNEETKIAFSFRYEGPTIPYGAAAVPPEHIGDIFTVDLEEDLSGHEVIIRNRAGWWVSFDFRYYRKKIIRCVQVAAEFAYAARASIEAGGLFRAREWITQVSRKEWILPVSAVASEAA